ncbi:MAG: Rossmann-like and DUF2520 domain-containing protein [Acidaminococcaceae bacterium]
MRIGIIGAGKVGGALCKSLREAGVNVVGLTAGTEPDTLAAAAKFQVKGFASNEELAANSDVLFLTVPDRLVGEVAAELTQAFSNRSDAKSLQGKTFFHCSGSLGLEELQLLAELGADIGSLHPLQSFASADVSFQGIYMAVDGMPNAQEAGQAIAELLGAQIFVVPAAERKAYHAAACFASNYVVAAMAVAQELMSKWTPTPEAGLAALLALFDGTARNLHQSKLAREALTGPIARGDINTVKAHLAVLPPKIAEVYKALGKETICLARANGTIDARQAEALASALQ